MRGLLRASVGLVVIALASGCGVGKDQEGLSDLPEAVTNGAGWFPVGPAPVDDGQVYVPMGKSAGLPVTGRSSAIAVNPLKAGEVFLGTASGGIWHSNNATAADANWTPLGGTNAFKSLAIGAIAAGGCSATHTIFCTDTNADTCGCNDVWVGTGENGRRRDTHAGAGLYRYTESGGEIHSFDVHEVAGTATAFKGGNIFKILPEGGANALVLLSEGVTSNSTHSTVIAPPPPSGYGIFRVSDFGAGSITALPVPGVGSALPSDLERRPDNQQTLFAAYFGVGVFRSTDGGASWCGLNTGTLCPGACGLTPPANFTHVELTVSPSDSNVVYASFGTCFARREGVCDAPIPIFRSGDGGTTWTQLAVTPVPDGTTDDLESYAGYTDVLVATPNNASRFFFGGSTVWDCSGSTTPNPANTCSGVSAPYTCTGVGSRFIHPDIHDVAFGGADTGTIYVTSDGGFYASTDSGANFQSAARTLGVTQFNSISAYTGPEQLSDPIVLGGLQDNGGVLFGGTRNWTRVTSGDGGDTVLDRAIEPGGYRLVRYVGIYDESDVYRYATGLAPAIMYLPGSNPASKSAEAVPMYPIIEQHPTTKDLYTGRQSLSKSTDTDTIRGDAWETISPVLADTSVTFDAIQNTNNITAIGLSPSNPAVVYVGYYNGQLFVSNAGSGPCAMASCWTQIAGPGVTANVAIPTGPITTISVHPTTPAVAYVTVSGFGAGPHVLRNNNATATGWEDFSQGVPAGEPANVVRIMPNDPTELWLGTEGGLYHRLGTAAWEREGGRFPPVPVYDVSIERGNNRVYAATHGRGAWVRTQPAVSTLEGWAMGTIWDIPITGVAFLNTTGAPVTCSVELVQQSGTVCAAGSVDAHGGTAQINAEGTLVTTLSGQYQNKPVFWGCYNGTCINNTPIAKCNYELDGAGNPTTTLDPVSAVRVICPGSAIGVGSVMGAPEMTAPPTNVFSLQVPGGPMPRVLPGQKVAAAMLPGGGSFDLAVSLQSGAGLTRQICHTTVDFQYSEPEAIILARAVEQLNQEADCIAESIEAHFHGPVLSDPSKEDPFEDTANVSVTAPTLTGSRILVTMRVLPGAADDVCFTTDHLLSSDFGQATIMKMKPITGENGAEGGTITVSEGTGIGACTRTITTTAGQTADDVAAAIVAAFNGAGNPGPAECLADANARDLVAFDDNIFAAFAQHLTFCSSDPGVGVVVGPEEIDLVFNKPPVALCDNPTLSVGSSCTDIVSVNDIDAGSFDPDGPDPDCELNATGPFGPGMQTLTLTCTDEEGATASCTSVVTFVDTTPPALNCPVSINTLCTSPSGANASYSVSATDNCGVVGTPACSPASGGSFALGTRLAACNVADTSGNASACNFNITVLLGDNPVCCPSGSTVVLGTSNNDTLNGGSGRDCIFGRGGQDTINGNGGNDLVSGGDGNDIITGGIGNDFLVGGSGQDRVSGNAGDDFMSGGDNDDLCFGGDDNDILLGHQGQDQLYGENGNDTLVGETGDDRLEGGSGNDSLDGDGMHDICIGGPGTDVFLVCESQTQ